MSGRAMRATVCGCVLLGVLRGPIARGAGIDLTTPYEERYEAAVESLGGASAPSDPVASIRVLLDGSMQLGREDEALAILDRFLESRASAADGYQDAHYARATLLFRAGREDESLELFRAGIAKGWTSAAHTLPSDSFLAALYDHIDPVRYAIEAYHAALEDPRAYARRGCLLRILAFEHLRPDSRKGFSAMTELFPRLRHRDDLPLLRENARAVCLIIDGRSEEARALLRKTARAAGTPIAPRPDPDEPATYLATNEAYNIRLYLAAASLCGDGSPARARTLMQGFLELNASRSAYVAERLLRVGYALQRGTSADRARVGEITGFLLDRDLESKVPADLFRHLLSMEMYFRRDTRDWDGTKRYADELLARYDAGNVSCQSALYLLGREHYESEAWDEARALFKRLFEEATDPGWRRVGAHWLLFTGIACGEDPKALEAYRAALASAPPEEHARWSYARALRRFERYADARPKD